MSQYLIMCRSLTYAQRASRLLERAGITAVIIKAPQQLTGSGCGYAVSIRRNLETAVNILRSANASFGKLYEKDADGGYTEVKA